MKRALMQGRHFHAAVTIAGAGMLIYTLPLSSFDPGVLLFLVLAVVAEAVHLPSWRLSIGFALAFPVLILYGPGMAAWVGALGFVLAKTILRRPVREILFGGARSAMAILAAAWAYHLAGGGPAPLESRNWFALSLVSPVYFLVDMAVNGIAALESKQDPHFDRASISLDLTAHIVLTAYGLLLATASVMKGWYGVVLAAVSLAAVVNLMRLLSRLEMNNQELRILQETSYRLSSTLRLDRVFDTIAYALIQLAQPHAVGLFLADKMDGSLELRHLKEFDKETMSDVQQAAWKETVSRLARDMQRDAGYGYGKIVREPAGAAGMRSFLLIPLFSAENLIGLLAAGHRSAHHFNAEHLRLSSIISGQLAAAVDNALLYEKTENMAVTDPMTCLYNYRYFYRRLEEEVKRARSQDSRVSLIYIDLDRFSQFNNCFGHQAGDDVLKQFADILRESVRQSDVPARYAGDEFVVVLPGSGREEAWEVVRRIEAATSNHHFRIGARGILVRLNFSAGVACFPDDALTQDELIFKADKAMYRAKTAERPGESAL